ncbi:unnamed protein product [Soboliphyme baturini]|uniref:Tetraspanin n=1 Tax=Soboliphyme baturini TaxID=241478 RepID=A0A183JAT5_9BILA|nr:unnamed protein product [Soboliphyme baturini]
MLIVFSLIIILLYSIVAFSHLYPFRFIIGAKQLILTPIAIGLCIAKVLTSTLFGMKATAERNPKMMAFIVWTSLNLAIFNIIAASTIHGRVLGSQQSTLTNSLWKLMMTYESNDEWAIEQLNNLQQEFECCGVQNPQSWLELISQTSKWSQGIPWSCCRLEMKISLPCLHSNYYLLLDNLYLNESTIYEEGCDTAINKMTNSWLRPTAWGLLAVGFGQLLATVLMTYLQTSLIEMYLNDKDKAKGYLFKY